MSPIPIYIYIFVVSK